VLRPDVGVDVALFWHQWQLQGRGALLDQIGQALACGARQALGVQEP
jgi:LysR family transcriptional regulator (chromosome initiation inhibitor)